MKNNMRLSTVWGWLGFIFFGLALTYLTSFSVSNIPEQTEAGMVLKQDIRADRRITVVNQLETQADQEKAAASVLPVFDYDETLPDTVPRRLHRLLSKPIIANQNLLQSYKETGVVLFRINPPSGTSSENKEVIIKDISQVATVEQMKNRLYPSDHKWIVPNTTFNLKETETRKKAAMRDVKEKIITYQAGDYILRAGTKLEPRDVQLLDMIRTSSGLVNRPLRFVGAFLFVALALGTTFYFCERFIRRFRPKRQDYIFMGLVVVGTLFLLRVSLILAGVMHEALFYELPRTALYYAIPIAGGVMLIRMFLSAEISMVLSVILSLLAGLTVGSGLDYTTYCLISGITASSVITRATSRFVIIRAGFWTGLISALAVLGILLIQLGSTDAPLHLASLAWHLGFALSGGIFSALLVFFASPIVEYLFDYTTDIKLMEMANLNHPLLKELIVRAPGTYHHSHIVGVLAESAAEAIGANPLLARVGAYYHDIGKMKKPEYYIENDPESIGRHEALSPHMSALIVSSHVKEGITMAREHRLPQAIIDMIPQHHGTKRIGIFFEKAKEQAGEDANKVEEKDFRYQGPKPQTQEAGILMLADGVEATVRSLKDKSPAKIQKTVETIIDRSFAEAQLDDCDLTLKDLHEIGKAFTRIATALYHQRIEYGDLKPDQTASIAKAGAQEAQRAGEGIVHKLKFPQSNG